MLIFQVAALTLSIQCVFGMNLSEEGVQIQDKAAIVSPDSMKPANGSYSEISAKEIGNHTNSSQKEISVNASSTASPLQVSLTKQPFISGEDESDFNDMSAAESQARQIIALLDELDKVSLQSLFKISDKNHHYWTRKRGRDPTTTENYWGYDQYYYPRQPTQYNRIPFQRKKRMAPINATSELSPRDSDITTRMGQQVKPPHSQHLEAQNSTNPPEDSLRTSLPKTTERQRQKNFPRPHVPQL